VLQGLGMAAVLLGGQAWLVAQGWSGAQGRAVVFSTLVLGVMLLILANRDLSRPALMGVTDPHPWLWRMAAAMALLLAAVLGVPVLRDLDGPGPARHARAGDRRRPGGAVRCGWKLRRCSSAGATPHAAAKRG
jgi:Ca2+-transporting ATPase